MASNLSLETMAEKLDSLQQKNSGLTNDRVVQMEGMVAEMKGWLATEISKNAALTAEKDSLKAEIAKLQQQLASNPTSAHPPAHQHSPSLSSGGGMYRGSGHPIPSPSPKWGSSTGTSGPSTLGHSSAAALNSEAMKKLKNELLQTQLQMEMVRGRYAEEKQRRNDLEAERDKLALELQSINHKRNGSKTTLEAVLDSPTASQESSGPSSQAPALLSPNPTATAVGSAGSTPGKCTPENMCSLAREYRANLLQKQSELDNTLGKIITFGDSMERERRIHKERLESALSQLEEAQDLIEELKNGGDVEFDDEIKVVKDRERAKLKRERELFEREREELLTQIETLRKIPPAAFSAPRIDSDLAKLAEKAGVQPKTFNTIRRLQPGTGARDPSPSRTDGTSGNSSPSPARPASPARASSPGVPNQIVISAPPSPRRVSSPASGGASVAIIPSPKLTVKKPEASPPPANLEEDWTTEPSSLGESADQQFVVAVNSVMTELLNTEERYVKLLRTCIDVFYRPLDTLGDQVINFNSKNLIFTEFETIKNAHSELLKKFRKVSEDPDAAEIGKLFMEIADLSKLYIRYSKSYETAVNTIADCEQVPAFAAWLERAVAKPQCNGVLLETFLMVPIQRFATYHPHLLCICGNSVIESRFDYEELQNALKKFQKYAKSLTEKRRDVEAIHRVVEISRRVQDLPERLLQPKRRFIVEGTLDLVDKKKRYHGRHFILLNDLLIETRKGSHAGADSKLQTKYRSMISLTTAKLTEEPDKNEPLVFKVTAPNDSYLLSCPTLDLKVEWVQKIKTAIESCTKEETKNKRLSLKPTTDNSSRLLGNTISTSSSCSDLTNPKQDSNPLPAANLTAVESSSKAKSTPSPAISPPAQAFLIPSANRAEIIVPRGRGTSQSSQDMPQPQTTMTLLNGSIDDIPAAIALEEAKRRKKLNLKF